MIEVVGIGARTPVGLTAATSAAAIRAGVARLREFSFVSLEGQPIVVGADALLPDSLQGAERMLALVEAPLQDALDGVNPKAVPACKVWLSLPEARPGFSDEDATRLGQHIVLRIQKLGFRCDAAIGGRGHAGVMGCVRSAIATPNDEVLHIVVGVDSHCDDECLVWLERERLLAQEGTRGGFTPGEAAGVIVLAHRRLGERLGRKSLATISGAGLQVETRLRDSDAGSFGEAMSRAVQEAGRKLSLPAQAADDVYCDINGDRYRSEEWGFFAMRSYSAVASLGYETPCPSVGDIGASFGAVAAAMATNAFERGYARGPRALVMAGSNAGHRGAMFLHEPQSKARA
ncbi:MAG: hypothetical protein AAF799_27340 [Myxococcota bacterium]